MKNILINTSHNISIKYELASVMHRAMACGLDLVILVVYFIIAANLVGFNTMVSYILVLFIPGFYHLFFEVFFDGQSPGKKLMKIRVVTLSGRKPTLEDYFLRWIFRSIEVTSSIGILAAINISSTEKNQRIGDILAETTVIKVLPENTVSLDTLKSLDDKERDILYPGIAQYSDTDMLLVKEALGRFRNQNNHANRKFIRQMAARISDDLDVKIEGSKVKFLENALIDYIFMTR